MELKPKWETLCINVGGLLIVPYGIETIEVRRVGRQEYLLIVPYGIETRTHQFLEDFPALF